MVFLCGELWRHEVDGQGLGTQAPVLHRKPTPNGAGPKAVSLEMLEIWPDRFLLPHDPAYVSTLLKKEET